MEQVISFSAAAGVIDEVKGIIRGVSLITEGVALGHKVVIDAKTLQQVKTAAESYAGGLKVNLNHNSGAGDIVGYIDNFSIVGQKLIGDLNLLQSSPHRNYILEIANKIPDTFGLSIAFSGPSEMAADKKTMLQRCSEIYSVDIVSEPAANPAGFFSRKLNQLQTDKTGTETNTLESGTPETESKLIYMNPELKKEIEVMMESALMSMNDRMKKLEAHMPEEKKPDAAAAMSAQNEAVQLAAKFAAESALKEFAKTFGAPAVASVSAEAAAPAKVESKFETIVAAKCVELKGDKAAAISFSVKNNPTEYASFRSRVQAGELIKL
jgi:hypothetical protein